MKKSIKSLKLGKMSISNLTFDSSKLVGGVASDSCCDFTCSCDNPNPNPSSKCNIK